MWVATEDEGNLSVRSFTWLLLLVPAAAWRPLRLEASKATWCPRHHGGTVTADLGPALRPFRTRRTEEEVCVCVCVCVRTCACPVLAEAEIVGQECDRSAANRSGIRKVENLVFAWLQVYSYL